MFIQKTRPTALRTFRALFLFYLIFPRFLFSFFQPRDDLILPPSRFMVANEVFIFVGESFVLTRNRGIYLFFISSRCLVNPFGVLFIQLSLRAGGACAKWANKQVVRFRNSRDSSESGKETCAISHCLSQNKHSVLFLRV